MEKAKRKIIGPREAAWCIALALLLGVMLYVNFSPSSGTAGAVYPAEPMEENDGVPFGFQPGERVPDFTLTTTQGEAWALRAARGKVTVVNLWATWCAPCVQELPYFQEIYDRYGDDLAVLAIHSNLITDDVGAYLADRDFTLPFAVDEDGQVIASLGGSTMLPQTIVLNPRGVVTYNQVGSVTLEKLTALVEQAAGEQ